MKTIKKITSLIIHMSFSQVCFILSLALILSLSSCGEDFLYKQPQGVLFADALNNAAGVNYLLTGAYSALPGSACNNMAMAYPGSVKNWVFDCASDNAYKGTTFSDTYDMGLIERYEAPVTNYVPDDKWIVCYDGISRVNDVLRALKNAKDVDAATALKIEAQARFIRGWWHFRLQKVFWQIPYITENVDPKTVKNDHKVWPEIEEDMQFGIDNLPGKWPGEPGRFTKWAAMAYMAYVHLYQKQYSEAKPLLDAIINSGNFDLVTKYHDNFDPNTENNIESIFEIQSSVNDGSAGTSYENGNADSWVTHPLNTYLPTCCNLYQPSLDLVNAFKVDANGLPLLGITGPKFNDVNLENDMGLLSSATFIPTTNALDPRLDWTVGRRGIPYLDWGIMTGDSWVRSQVNGGPFLGIKEMYYKKDKATASASNYARATSINFRKLRFTHVLLWRAEIAVEENDLETARQIVNRIRRRAANPVNLVMGLCTTYAFSSTTVPTVDYSKPAANYQIGEYPSFPSQPYARAAVQMEERLEFGMEGNRFFDLVRWGIDYDVLTQFIVNDSKYRTFMVGAHYTKDKNSRWPIPQAELDIEPNVLEQDPLWK